MGKIMNVIEMGNNGGFCYYSECKRDGECQIGYDCNVGTDTVDGVLYAYGICESVSGATGLRMLVVEIFVMIIIVIND